MNTPILQLMPTLLLFLSWFVPPNPSQALNDGLARTPPMGWRSWNLFGKNVTQDIMTAIIRGMADRKRTVDGVPTSLCDLGYCHVGLDDNWHQGKHYGENNGQCTYHDDKGNPLVNTERFPDFRAMTNTAHALNLTVGWYLNNCLCHERCKGPNSLNTSIDERIFKGKNIEGHADQRCYEGDVEALVNYGFDGVKLDACGDQKDLNLWHRLLENATSASNGRPILIEACHWGLTLPDWPSVDAGNTKDTAWCPFHFFRTSGDIWSSYGSFMAILQYSINSENLQRHDGSGKMIALSRPGCWAFLDMLEVGCNANGPNPQDRTLTPAETRTHFGAWAIVSSPLFLSHDVSNDTIMDELWPVIANPEAIAINQAWVGFPGGMFHFSRKTIKFTYKGSKFKPSIFAQIYLYKPISNDKVAVLLINSEESPINATLNFADVPDLPCGGGDHAIEQSTGKLKIPENSTRTAKCFVRDVWKRENLGTFIESFTATNLGSHDSAFLIISTPPTQATSIGHYVEDMPIPNLQSTPLYYFLPVTVFVTLGYFSFVWAVIQPRRKKSSKK